MRRTADSRDVASDPAAKARQRALIDRQLKEFLASGKRIEVVEMGHLAQPARKGGRRVAKTNGTAEPNRHGGWR